MKRISKLKSVEFDINRRYQIDVNKEALFYNTEEIV
jgi:hypothetical protein